jgi:hypothetical protein
MRRHLVLSGLALAAASLIAVGAPARSTAQPMVIQLPLDSLNGSGESGFATLEAMGSQTKVTLHVMGLPAGANQPSHIHEGTCANPNSAPAYPLNNVRDADTETVVDVSLQDLMARPYLINTHKSPQEISVYTTCGDLSWQ